jgi:hypothetical protein
VQIHHKIPDSVDVVLFTTWRVGPNRFGGHTGLATLSLDSRSQFS